MTDEMQYLMYLYAMGASGVSAEPPKKNIDINRVLELAKEQAVSEVISYAVKLSDGSVFSLQQRAECMSLLLGSSVANKLRSESVLKVLGALEQNGITATVLKGFDAARLYACPECRVSDDTDILVLPEQEEMALELFRSLGFSVTDRKSGEHHAVAVRGNTGVIEVHTSFWEEDTADILFFGCTLPPEHDSRQRVNYCGYDISVLGATDSLLFFTLHMIKHFFSGGIGLRMLYDTALYFRSADGIDTEYYWDTIDKFGYTLLIQTAFSVMVYYCDFEPEEFCLKEPVGRDIADAFVTDMEKGGFRGHNSALRMDAYYLYCRNQRKRKRGRLRGTLQTESEAARDGLGALFPSRSHMAKSYPYVQVHPWAYPAAWVCRFFSRGIPALVSGQTKSRKSLKNRDAISPEGRERIELFEKLNLL